jgi:hypothetical protein
MLGCSAQAGDCSRLSDAGRAQGRKLAGIGFDERAGWREERQIRRRWAAEQAESV